MDNVKFTRCIMNASSFDIVSGTAVFDKCMLEDTDFHCSELEAKFTGCSSGRTEIEFSPDMAVDAGNSAFIPLRPVVGIDPSNAEAK